MPLQAVPQWTPEFACHIPGLDQQHQELIQIFSDYLQTQEVGTQGKEKDLLHFLREYISRHFSAEEKMMTAGSYQGLEPHRQAHHEYIAEYKRILSEFKSNPNLTRLQLELQGMLRWFLAHIQEFDLPMGQALAGQAGPRGEAPPSLQFTSQAAGRLKSLTNVGVLNAFEQSINQEHQDLIDHFAGFLEQAETNPASPQAVEMLKFLSSYIKRHFENEEGLMARYAYPLAKLHKQAHRDYVARFQQLLKDFTSQRNLVQLTGEIAKMLDWFLEHIQEHDIRMSFYCKNRSLNLYNKKRPLIVADDVRDTAFWVEFFATFGLNQFLETTDPAKAFDLMAKTQVSLLVVASQGALPVQGLLARLKERDFAQPLLLVPSVVLAPAWAQLLAATHRSGKDLLLVAPVEVNRLVRQLDEWLFPFNQGAVDLKPQEEA